MLMVVVARVVDTITVVNTTAEPWRVAYIIVVLLQDEITTISMQSPPTSNITHIKVGAHDHVLGISIE